MAAGQRYPQALMWIDMETTGLPEGNDFSGVHILELGVIITDFDLQPLVGYTEIVKLTKEAADALRANEYVLNMHKANGLLKASAAASATLQDAEAGLLDTLKSSTFQPGELMIAGSGVAAYDFPLLKEKLPQVAKWLTYYPFDVGILRRTAKILAGRDLVNPTPASYQDGVKNHRAYDDVKAHLEEAGKYREWFREVTA